MKRVSGAMLVVGFILTISYFVAKYTSMFWGVLVLAGMMLVIGKILTMLLCCEIYIYVLGNFGSCGHDVGDRKDIDNEPFKRNGKKKRQSGRKH